MLTAQGNQPEADDRPEDRAEHQAKEGGLPSEKRSDGSHKFNVAQTHRFARQRQRFDLGCEVGFGLRIQYLIANTQGLGREAHFARHIAAVGQLQMPAFHYHCVRLAIEDFLEGNFTVRQPDTCIMENHAASRFEGDAFPAKKKLSQPKHQIHNTSTDQDAQSAAAKGGQNRCLLMQLWGHQRQQETDPHSSQSDLIGDDEMLEINEGGCDKSRQQNGRRSGRPRGFFSVVQPSRDKQHPGQSLDTDVARRNSSPARRTTTAQHQP